MPGRADLPRDSLRAQINVYEESITVRSFQEDGTGTVRMVSGAELYGALTKDVILRSGLLPQNTLWWTQGRQGPVIAIWKPPSIRRVALMVEPFQPPRRFTLPMPAMIFLCSPNRTPWVFAAKQRPQRPEDKVYRSPTFNTFRDGRVCPGNHRFPSQPEDIPDSFFLSFFSQTGDTENRSKKHAKDLMKLWEELDGMPKYPKGDLVQHGTVADIMSI